MLILVANLGSTSFKYKLFRMTGGEERVLAVGRAERIGEGGAGAWSVAVGGEEQAGEAAFADHGAAVAFHLNKLVARGAIERIEDIEAIGFKAVHGGPIRGAVVVDEEVLATMERMAPLAPAHNPPYIAAMRSLRDRLPGAAQVAAFETAFHQTIPQARQVYGVPHEWAQRYGIRRYGFHGASHAWIAARMAEIAPDTRRIINLHLGGSCSLCAIRDGESVATSMGATPQTGVFHANRVGDFDPYAVVALRDAGLSEAEIFEGLGERGGLLGLSGVSGDIREVEQAAAGAAGGGNGGGQAQLALDAFVEGCRHYLGAYLVVLGGVDAVTFTGGIGQHDGDIRRAVCRDLAFAGIALDETKNAAASGDDERRIDAANSRVQVWVAPTNEELIVARQTVAALQEQAQPV